MKILIADDEPLVRVSLVSMFEEMALDVQLVGEAANGEELLEKLDEFRPDLAIVDIRMPKMNGLQAIEYGRRLCPNTKWIILSGFSEFDYARKAVKLGVSEYLLKPVQPEELEQVLTRIRQDQVAHTRLINKHFESEMIAMFHGLYLPDDQSSGLSRMRFLGAVLFVDSSDAETDLADDVRTLYATMTTALERFMTDNVLSALFVLPDGEWGVVLAYRDRDRDPNEERDRLLDRCMKKLVAAAVQCTVDDPRVTLWHTEKGLRHSALFEQMKQLQDWAEFRVLHGTGKSADYCELARFSKNQDWTALSRQVVDLVEAWQEGNFIAYTKVVQTWTDGGKATLPPSVKTALCDYLNHTIQCKLDACDPMEAWMNKLTKHGELSLKNRTDSGTDYIDQVMTYIEKNFMSDIGITQIAGELHVTPNYLSSLFHKKTGTTFMKYLTNHRMLKARELLADPAKQVQEVAEQVGYFSSRYFSKIFTRHAGCTPSEYQKKFHK